jgi:hypothetical protein
LGLSGEDGGIMKLDVVTQVEAVLSHGRLVWLFKTDVLLMLLQPRVHRTACPPNVDLAALIGDSLYTQCPKSQIIFDRLEETRYFLGRQAHWFDVMPGQHSADSIEYSPDIGQEGDWVCIIIGLTDVQMRVEDSVDLAVIVTILPENVPQEHQLYLQAVLIT